MWFTCANSFMRAWCEHNISQIHPLIQIWSLLATKIQYGDPSRQTSGFKMRIHKPMDNVKVAVSIILYCLWLQAVQKERPGAIKIIKLHPLVQSGQQVLRYLAYGSSIELDKDWLYMVLIMMFKAKGCANPKSDCCKFQYLPLGERMYGDCL